MHLEAYERKVVEIVVIVGMTDTKNKKLASIRNHLGHESGVRKGKGKLRIQESIFKPIEYNAFASAKRRGFLTPLHIFISRFQIEQV